MYAHIRIRRIRASIRRDTQLRSLRACTIRRFSRMLTTKSNGMVRWKIRMRGKLFLSACASHYGMLYSLHLAKRRISCTFLQYLGAQFALQSILKKRVGANDIVIHFAYHSPKFKI